jgi:WD40 repeat protein
VPGEAAAGVLHEAEAAGELAPDRVGLPDDAAGQLGGDRQRRGRWWDLDTGACLAPLEGHADAVREVALSGDGRRALLGSEDGTLRWWDLGTGTCLATLEGRGRGVSAMALSGDGRRALSGSYDGTVRWWDLERGRCLAVFTCDYPVTAVALSSQRPHVAVAGDDRGRVYFFDVVEPDEAEAPLRKCP